MAFAISRDESFGNPFEEPLHFKDAILGSERLAVDACFQSQSLRLLSFAAFVPKAELLV